MPRAISPSMRRLCLAFVASLALFARVLDAAPTDTQSNETLLNPLAVLSGNPALPRELRLPVGAASAALADVGLGPRAADAIERYGGTDETARDLALVLATVTAACGAGDEKAASVHIPATDAAARAETLLALFSGLSHELNLRRGAAAAAAASRLLSAEDPYATFEGAASSGSEGLRYIVDALDEACVSLSRVAANGNETEDASCFAESGGVVTRTLRAFGGLESDFETLVRSIAETSAVELARCGLGAFALEDESSEDFETLVDAARRTAACRDRGETEKSEDAQKKKLINVRNRVLASDLALREVVHAEIRAGEMKRDVLRRKTSVESTGNASNPAWKAIERSRIIGCLGEYAPFPDTHRDAPSGASLLTSTSVLSFLVTAAGDVTSNPKACARAMDSPKQVFFASPAVDAVAQEAAAAGASPFAAVVAWLDQTRPRAGSAGFEASIDELQAAARACARFAESQPSTSENATEEKMTETAPWIRADRKLLDSALGFLRRLESATLGSRGGARGYSAVGKLVRALETFERDLEAGGCFTSEEDAQRWTSDEVSSSSSSVSRARAVDDDRVFHSVPAEDLEIETDASQTSSGILRVSRLGAGLLLGALAFALVAAAAVARSSVRRKRSSVPGRSARAAPRGGSNAASENSRRDSSERDLFRDDHSSLLGTNAIGSARRFYRHLEAGSAGDLPLVEDLDRVSTMPGSRSPALGGSPRNSEYSDSPRPSTPPSTPYASLFFAPTTRRRSHSISEPPAASGTRGLPPRHQRRHTTRAEDV